MSELSRIAGEIDGVQVEGPTPDGVEVGGLVLDSREVAAGDLFACVPGAASDGHDHAHAAVEAGAVALLAERPLEGLDVPQLVVPSVRAALGTAANVVWDWPSRELEVYGVTGTNGKTTVTHLLRSILEQAGHTVGVIGTLGARIGDERIETGFTTPEAPGLQATLRAMADRGCDAVTMEVSSHALDQGRVDGTRFAATCFTNLTRDHLDYHTGFEDYFAAKRRLFTTTDDGELRPAAVNVDNEWGNRLFDELVHSEREDVPVWGYTTTGMARASVSAKYLLSPTGASITIESPVGDVEIASPLRGRFNVENVLSAATVALLAGVGPEDIAAGVAATGGVPGRFQAIDAGQDFQVIVDYAHTPDSLENVLRSAVDITDGDVILVFGCGGDRDRSKRPIMGQAAARLADVAIVTSDNPRSEDPKAIIREIVVGMRGARAEVVVEVDRQAAIEQAIGRARTGDTVVIAGKGHELGQEFADRTIPFDDSAVARAALDGAAV